MHDTASIKRHVSTVVITRIIFRGLVSVAFLLTYRYFTKAEQGILDIAITWTNAVMTLSDLGMSTLLLKHATQKKADAKVYFGNALLIQTIMSGVIWSCLLIAGTLAHFSSQLLWLLALIAAAGLIFEWRKVIRSILRAEMRTQEIAITEIANGALFILVILGIFFWVEDHKTGLLAFGGAQLLVNSLSVAVLFWFARKRLTPSLDLSRIWAMLRESIHFTLYNTFEMIYLQIDIIILSLMQTTVVVATYGGAAKIVTLFLFIPMTVFQVLLPALYSAAAKDAKRFRQLSLRTIGGFSVLGGSSMLLFLIFSDPLVTWILGSAYSDTIPIMRWLAVFLGMRFISIALTNILLARDYQKRIAYAQVGTVLANIALDILLIPQFGALGPAIATVVVETGNILVLSIMTRRLIFRPQNDTLH